MKTFTPYRICPLGAHVDHQWGKVTGFAIDKGITMEFEPTEDVFLRTDCQKAFFLPSRLVTTSSFLRLTN